MKKHQQIIEHLKAINFIQLPSQNFNASTGAYFLYTDGETKEVEKYLTVRYLARVDSYELMFGLNCSELRDFFSGNKLIANSVAEAIARMNIDRPYCWYRLPIRFGSRLNSWACKAEQGEMKIFFSNEFIHLLNEQLIPINSRDTLLQAYLKDESPFEWRLGTSYFARMCEIAYLVAYTKSNRTLAWRLADQYYSFMTKSDLFGSELTRDFFSILLENIEMQLAIK